MGLASDGLEEIRALNFELLNDCDAAEALAQLAFGQMSCGESHLVEETLLDARVRACSSGNSALEAEVSYASAFYHFSQGRITEAKSAAFSTLEDSADERFWSNGSTHLLSRHEVRSRAFDFLGHVAGRNFEYVEQASFARRSIEELDDLEIFDHYIAAKALMNLAAVCVEIDLPDVFDFVRDRVAKMTFSTHTRKFEFEIRRALGSCNALRGDHIGALREYRRSASVAPNIASQIKATIDRSILAEEIHEYTFADEELEHALALMKRVDWACASDGSILALLGIAQKLAKRDAEQARIVFDQYVQCKRRIHFTSGTFGNATYRAWEMHVDGIILRASGSSGRAIQANLEALTTYKLIGLDYRAAVVSAELFELTGEPSYLSYALTHAASIPHSRLARRVGALAQQAK